MMLGTWPNDCRTGVGRTKLSFWNTKFLEKYSVNLNFSTTYSHPWYSHRAMYQALLYLKTNQPVCLFTHSKGIKIGPSCQELRGVSKSPLGLKHPVPSTSEFMKLHIISQKYAHYIRLQLPLASCCLLLLQRTGNALLLNSVVMEGIHDV